MEQPAPDITHLTWASEMAHGCVRVSRARFRVEKRFEFGPHDHEFAEFLWVVAGQPEHLINGRTELLALNDYRCIRPGDVHVPRSNGGTDSTIINISFQPGPLAVLAERYGADWPWPADGPPRGGTLSPMMRERLSAWLEILSAPVPRRLDLEGFLIALTRMLSSEPGGARATGLPEWLGTALELFAEPRHFRGGVPELARLCGRSQEHVNRTVRSCQGRRATDLVNAVRLDWVASQLHISERSIEDLAEDCGLPNMAHFYRLFRAAFGMTPAAWRQELRSTKPVTRMVNLSPWVTHA